MSIDSIKKKKMSYASSGRKMKFYEDFYAITVVSYIYYEEDQNKREWLDRDLLINDEAQRKKVFADPK